MAEEENAVSLTPGALRLRWDVFLSFRGEDTRHNVANSIYLSLEKLGVRVFRDDDGLRRGDDISVSLQSAIEDSAASIVIVSPRYADSHWCLEELVKICGLQRLILPVFYRVNPSDFLLQTGDFAEDLRQHEKRFSEETIAPWKEAMEKVGALRGWVIREGSDETVIIESLVKRVSDELSKTPLNAASNRLFGLDDSHVDELVKKMEITCNGVRILGLHGKSGVGKTTLAKVLYKKLSTHFEFHSFVQNVREIAVKPYGLSSLQTKLIDDLSANYMPPITEFNAKIDAIRWIVHEQRVLIILDDVDSETQLELLIGNRLWFQEGSRIIITTTSESSNSFLRDYVDEVYEVSELDKLNAQKLFSYQALRREEPKGNFVNLADEIVTIIGGVPLALEICGSLLYDKRSEREWEDIINKLKEFQPCHLQNVVKTCIDSLDSEEKSIFLDLSCLFVEMEMKREDLIDILDGCGFSGEIALRNLVSKSLIKITEKGTLWMHDQIKDVGRQIVREENLADPSMRSRLWETDQIFAILNNEKGTNSIRGIVMNWQQSETVDLINKHTDDWGHIPVKIFGPIFVSFTEEIFKSFFQNKPKKPQGASLCSRAFDKLSTLKLLQMNNVVLERGFRSFPAKLKWLMWKGCPLVAFPSDYCPQNLAVLDLSESRIEKFSGHYSHKATKNLLVINLRSCHNLTTIPDLSGHKQLRKLVLEGCTRLTKIHESIGNMTSLLHLNLRNCSNLIELPTDLAGLKRLQSIILSGCKSLQKLPESIERMRSLIELLADETAITSLPCSIFHLTKLERLSLNGCEHLNDLPEHMGKLCSLKELCLDDSAVVELPNSFGSLEKIEKLSLANCGSLKRIPNAIDRFKMMTELLIDGSLICELPESIGMLSNLKILSLGKCHNLKDFPNSVTRLVSLAELRLNETPIASLPEAIGELVLLQKLEMKRCRELLSLPKSVGNMSLTTLNLLESNIAELPESLGHLRNLRTLILSKCRRLTKLPASIGGLKSLHDLFMEDTAVTELPESFGKLSNLRILRLAKNHRPDETPVESGHTQAASCNSKNVSPTSFSNLSLLNELDAGGWKAFTSIACDFEKLTSLETLNLGYNSFVSLPLGFNNLSSLKKLLLPHCKELRSLPPLPFNLLVVNLSNCSGLESMPDISGLVYLQELNLTNCEKLVDVLGLESLKSLRRLYLGGCCNDFLSTVKGKLLQLSLNNICNLVMPGSKIPDWFLKNLVTVSERKDLRMNGAIFCGVVSNAQMVNGSNHHFLREDYIQIKIVKSQKVIYSESLRVIERPKLNEDQVHLYQFPSYHPLVSKLDNGCRIQANISDDVASAQMVELKEFGFHLVYRGEQTLNDSR